nr:hypothetical protein [Tanacetum cinerariifolium]
MSFNKRQGSDAVCYTKPLDSLKGWNDNFFIDAFAYPASFLWHMSKSVSRDVIPKSSKFNVEHYATLVAYPASFHKYPEPFLCLVGLSRNYTLDENTYPQFLHDNDEGGCLLSCFIYALPVFDHVRIGERQLDEDEPKLLETTVGRVVSLLPVAPDHSSGDLEAGVDKLFDEGVVVSRRSRVTPQVVGKVRGSANACWSHAQCGGPGGPIPSFPFMTSSVPFALVITTAIAVTLTADPVAVTKEKIVEPSLFSAGSASGGETDPAMGGFVIANLSGNDFLIGDEVQALTDRNAILEKEKGELNVKATDLAASVKVKEQELDTDLVEMALHLEKRFYPHLLTIIFGRQWLLTYGLKHAIAKCLNSTEYISTLRAVIGKAIEKGMQDGLSVEITHGAKGRVLTDVAAYNPSAEADYLSALQRLTKLQPHVDQLMVPIHHFPNQRVVGASALSLSAFVRYGFNGTKSTLNVIPATVDTTTALSVTSVTVSLIPPISIDDYEIAHAEGRESTGADVNPFPNVDDTEMNTS